MYPQLLLLFLMDRASLNRKLITTVVKKGTEFTEAVSMTLKQEKLTIQQFNVLRILRGRKGEAASLQDVSKDMIHNNSNTTRVIDKLVTKNLVKRIQCPTDRRQIELTITQDGLDLLSKIDKKVEASEADILKETSDEDLNLLIELLNKI